MTTVSTKVHTLVLTLVYSGVSASIPVVKNYNQLSQFASGHKPSEEGSSAHPIDHARGALVPRRVGSWTSRPGRIRAKRGKRGGRWGGGRAGFKGDLTSAWDNSKA